MLSCLMKLILVYSPTQLRVTQAWMQKFAQKPPKLLDDHMRLRKLPRQVQKPGEDSPWLSSARSSMVSVATNIFSWEQYSHSWGQYLLSFLCPSWDFLEHSPCVMLCMSPLADLLQELFQLQPTELAGDTSVRERSLYNPTLIAALFLLRWGSDQAEVLIPGPQTDGHRNLSSVFSGV